ncbi:MAG: MFS transporter [Treponema sp.]|nr:MFS transporter [Treponema sp.]
MSKFQRVLLFILLFGTMLIFGMVENFKGVSFPLIRGEFGASWEQMGLMISMISIFYTGFSVLAGIFLGRFGVKPSYLLGFSIISAGFLAVFYLPGFFLTASALLLASAGFGFFEISINALASKLFVKRAALLMNLLHSFYGFGAVIGPIAAGYIAGSVGLSWRHAYLFTLPVSLALLIPAIIIRFPEDPRDIGVEQEKRSSFFDTLRSPLVWLMAITLSIMVTVEMSSANWGTMYFQDIYGFDPNTDGATFLSRFFMLFTISRLICGFAIEKIGYMRALLGAAIISSLVFIIGFLLGETGILVLPALGFFAAIYWPTLMAVTFIRFGKDAPIFSGAVIAISGIFFASIQFLTGLINSYFGSAWGYRSNLVYSVILIALLVVLQKKLVDSK